MMARAEASPTVGSLEADILLLNPAISKYHVKLGKRIIKLNGNGNNGKRPYLSRLNRAVLPGLWDLGGGYFFGAVKIAPISPIRALLPYLSYIRDGYFFGAVQNGGYLTYGVFALHRRIPNFPIFQGGPVGDDKLMVSVF